MTKFFISMPMVNKSDAEIIKQEQECRKWMANWCGDYAESSDGYVYEDAPSNLNGGQIGIWYIAKSLEKMAECDAVVMWGDWKNARGCLLEREAAIKYGIPVIENGGMND